ncbi:hypothetical protein CLG96_06450 [Sphingomonas oleivorans]|uniref:HTH LytTR-type domain-containing protein n=1 Tax=Sphingomonas oleivorans TaxID=1735121 RepID=A0A2T5FZR5_9SPHN|nr:LytTR family DNA-binding domain-containing protein [Sphingomonas oleivorans]PTQ12189.1 hypothetical protein CLG96_06450 [Sphingomonas oleivorans]
MVAIVRLYAGDLLDTLAIFSIWALLTPPIILIVRRCEASLRLLAARIGIYLLGLPLSAMLHVVLFAFLYWPIFNNGGRIRTRWEMAGRVFEHNFEQHTLLYLMLVGLAVIHGRWHGRWAGRRALPEPMPPAAALVIRSRGQVRQIPIAEIDWIGAAGDYAELHVGSTMHLLEESLTSLAARLPAEAFARIHRASIVRRDRIASVTSLGRGDALVRLIDGTELRLSRRYRASLNGLLARGGTADPAGPVDRSRPTIGAG